MTTQKLYNEMTTEEQLRWVQDFSDVLNKNGERIAQLAKDNRAVWTVDDHRMMHRLFALLGAWQFAQDFVAKALRFGDYDRRAYRLPLYIEKVNGMLADGLTMTDERGRAVAVVLPGAPLRRRGRPTKEETAARMRGEVVIPTDDSPETRKRRLIAQMLGLEVVNGEPQREKNNAELKVERDKRKAEEAKMNPSLFGGETAEHTGGIGISKSRDNDISTKEGAVSPCAQIMSDSYEARMAQDKLHLDQLAWLMSKPLQERVKLVQSQRTAAESASERAKTMADLGQPADAIAEYAQQAKVATEAYLQTYADIDTELAILHKRLYLDLPFVEQFKQRFKGVDVEKIQYITRPYYEKVKSPDLDLRIKTIIEQENPEYAAKMKAEEEKKQEVSDLLRYLKRKDKPNVKQRIETMEKRYQRLIELLGEEESKVYRPIVDAAIEDYEANHKKPTVVSDSLTKDQSVALQSVADKKKGTKKETKKTTTTKKSKK